MSATCKPFKIQYIVQATGEVKLEQPRKMVTFDGKRKSLMIGTDTVLYSVPVEASDDDLWLGLKQKLHAEKGI